MQVKRRACWVYISHDTWRHIRGKVDIGFADMGAQSLNNLTESMRARRLHIDPRWCTEFASLSDAAVRHAANAGFAPFCGA